MGIIKIYASVPNKNISNQYLIDLMRENSGGDIDEYERHMRIFFNKIGAKSRFWRSNDSEPNSIISDLSKKMLRDIDVKRIKVVIYCSVYKYYAEPAHASLYCNKWGINPEYCFDVSDGCMGWLTSLDIIQKLSDCGVNGYAIILSHEFPMMRNGAIHPKSFRVDSLFQLNYKLPAMTLGEASSITLVKMNSKIIDHHRMELPKGAFYCTYPYKNINDYYVDSDLVRNHGEFITHFQKMIKIGGRQSINLINNFIKHSSINLVAHSYTMSFEKLSWLVNAKLNIVNGFEIFGNTASSSIPLNLHMGYNNNKIKNEIPTYAWCASAGMKVSLSRLHMETIAYDN